MNYYNEHDPKAAAWLRELIAGGHIPAGDVDERSISDVRPDELRGYTQQHFFAGIGGWSLALRLAGWPDDRPVRTGSCPCQPFSAAGLGLGTADARHLWPVFRDLITFGEATITFGEQVASAAGRLWLAGIRADLEGLGYAVGAGDLCSAGVGSPNIRQRLYWMAHTSAPRRGALQRPVETDRRPAIKPYGHRDLGGLAYADGRQSGDGRLQPSGIDGLEPAHGGALGNPGCGSDKSNRECGDAPRATSKAPGKERQQRGGNAIGDADQGAVRVGNTDQPGSQGRHERGHGADQWTPWAASVVLPCTDGKARRIEPGSFPLAHGIPGRVGLLRGYGNAINPWLAAEFILACEEALI